MITDIINQITSDPYTRWYMDSVKLEGNEYHFEGWIYNSKGDVQNIFINGIPVLNLRRLLRNDVNMAMGLNSMSNSKADRKELGVKFIIPKELRNEKITIQVNGDIIEIGSILKWIAFNTSFKSESKDLIVVDNFYDDPDLIREFGMKNLGFSFSDYHKGQRSTGKFYVNGTKEKFERIIGKRITNWDKSEYANGVFQYCTTTDPIVYHVDSQTYAAMIFLTPDAPLETGTAFYKSKVTGATEFYNDETFDQNKFDLTFKGVSNQLNFYDRTQFELMDSVANVYNRLVLFNAKRIHAASMYFGDAIENARFFQLFFFDIE